MRTLAILLCILCYACTTVSQQTCMTTSAELSQLDTDFKSELKRLYKIKGEPKSEHYKKYLEGIASQMIPREFFTDSIKVEEARYLMENPVYKLVWSKFSKVEERSKEDSDYIEIEPPRTASDDPAPEKKDYYVLDPNSVFLTCLIDNMAEGESKNLLKEVQKVSGVNPGIIAQSLIELNKFEDPALQVYIGFQFYHDFIFMMNGLNRIE